MLNQNSYIRHQDTVDIMLPRVTPDKDAHCQERYASSLPGPRVCHNGQAAGAPLRRNLGSVVAML